MSRAAKSQPNVAGAPLPRLEQIYVEAARLFAERGFAATSMSDIAEAVGVTKAGLYHFVASKDELLFTLMNWGLDILDRDVVEPALQESDAVERLRLIVRNHALSIAALSTPQGNPVAIVMEELAGLAGRRKAAITARKRRYFDFVRDTLRTLRAEGRLRDIDPNVAAFSIIGMIVWLARWRKPDGKVGREQIAEQMADIALGGVVKRRTRA
jgi:AcrR family transcriptional regulator